MKKINKVVLSSLAVGMAPTILASIPLTSCGTLFKISIPHKYLSIFEDTESGEVILEGFKDEYLDKLGSYNTLQIPKEVTTIQDSAFQNSLPSNIKNLTFENGSQCQYINNSCFQWSPIENVDFSNSKLVNIGASAFYESNIKKLDLSKNTTLVAIGMQAFSNCEKLETIKLNCYIDSDGNKWGLTLDPGVFFFDKEHKCNIKVLDLSQYDEPGLYLNTTVKNGDFAGWPETGKIILSDKLTDLDVRNMAAMIATTEQTTSVLQSVNGGLNILGWFDVNDPRVKAFSKELFVLENEGTICYGPGNWLSFNEYNKESLLQNGNCVQLEIPSTVTQITYGAFDSHYTTLPSNFVFVNLQNAPIVNISDLAFCGQPFYNILALPSTLEEIGDAAFVQMMNIEQISFNEIDMKKLEVKAGAFGMMLKLRTLDFSQVKNFPGTVVEIDEMAAKWTIGASAEMSGIDNMFDNSGPILEYEGTGTIYLDDEHFITLEDQPAYKERLIKFFADLGLIITNDSNTRWTFAKPV